MPKPTPFAMGAHLQTYKKNFYGWEIILCFWTGFDECSQLIFYNFWLWYLQIDVSDHTAKKPKPQPAPRKTLVRRPSALSSRQNSLSLNLDPTGPPDRTYKVVFAGDAAVGKTSFINRITKGIFVNNLSSTLGVDFQVKTIRVDERNIALQLWDTAGKIFCNELKQWKRKTWSNLLLF